MDLIDAELATMATNPKFAPSLRGAISLGKKLLNKYYAMTDNSHVYWTAMSEWYFFNRRILFITCQFLVLHLSHKDRYFETMGWEDDWITTARNIVRDEFEQEYATVKADDDSEESLVCFFTIFQFM